MAALGCNVWVVAVALPAARGGLAGLTDAVLVTLPLLALALGLRGLARDRVEALGLLAVGVPTLLATAIAGRQDPSLGDRYGTATTLLSALSGLAYVVAVADAFGRPARLRPTVESKLALGVRARPASRGLRAWVLGTTILGALALAVVLPSIGGASVTAAWGEAAAEGRVLTAIVGATIACIAAAVIVGPSLRAARPSPVRAGEGMLSVTLWLVVAATGAIAWAILRTVSP